MYLLSRSDLAEGRAALEEWVKCEDPSSQGGRMDTVQKRSSGAHLSKVRAKVYF